MTLTDTGKDENSTLAGKQTGSILHFIMWTPHTVCHVEFVWDLTHYITKAVLSVYFMQEKNRLLLFKSNVTSENRTLECLESIPIILIYWKIQFVFHKLTEGVGYV